MIEEQQLAAALVDTFAMQGEMDDESNPIAMAGIDVAAALQMAEYKAESLTSLCQALLRGEPDMPMEKVLASCLGAAWADGLVTGVRAARSGGSDVD